MLDPNTPTDIGSNEQKKISRLHPFTIIVQYEYLNMNIKISVAAHHIL